MARQEGLLKLSGPLGDLSFYYSKYGWIVRRKGGPTAKQINGGKQFARVRENMSEFGHCGRAAGLVRKALFAPLKEAGDTGMVARLTKLLSAVIKLDLASVKGQRNLLSSLLHYNGKPLLCGFNFNTGAPFDRILKTIPKLDDANRILTLPAFNPATDVSVPPHTTHTGFTAFYIYMDVAAKQHKTLQSDTVYVPLLHPVQDITLALPDEAVPAGVTFYVLKVCFYQEVNGQLALLKNKDYNAMAIVG